MTQFLHGFSNLIQLGVNLGPGNWEKHGRTMAGQTGTSTYRFGIKISIIALSLVLFDLNAENH